MMHVATEYLATNLKCRRIYTFLIATPPHRQVQIPSFPHDTLTWGSGVVCTSQHDPYFWNGCDDALCCDFFFSLDSGSSSYPSFYLCFCSCSSSSWSLDFGSCFYFSFSWNSLQHVFKQSRFTDGEINLKTYFLFWSSCPFAWEDFISS